jgi:hypothetical protein
MYIYGAFVFVVFVIFLSGERILTFERSGTNNITATLETRRWLGFATIDVRQLDGVKEYSNKHQVDAFDDTRIEGTVLIGDGKYLMIPGDVSNSNRLASRISDVLPIFIDNSEPKRELRERIPFLTLPVTLVVAMLFPFLGLTADPMVVAPSTKYQELIGRFIRRGFVILSCLAGMQLFWIVWQFHAEQGAAKKRLESTNVTVLETDLIAGNDVLYGDAWKVMVNNPSFTDVDLFGLIPELQHAPGLWLDLSNTRVTDEGLRSLKELDSLIMLSLKNTNVTFRAFEQLKHVSIRYLDVRNTRIVANDLKHLGDRYLTHLLFSDPEFATQSIPALFKIRGLKYVYIDTHNLTREDLTPWKQELEAIVVELPSG